MLIEKKHSSDDWTFFNLYVFVDLVMAEKLFQQS